RTQCVSEAGRDDLDLAAAGARQAADELRGLRHPVEDAVAVGREASQGVGRTGRGGDRPKAPVQRRVVRELVDARLELPVGRLELAGERAQVEPREGAPRRLERVGGTAESR